MIPWLPNASWGMREHSWLGFHQWELCLGRGHANTLCPPLQNRNRSGYLQELFKETDLNKDKELSFEEFTIVLSKVADDAHRIIHGENRCKPESN